MIIDSNVHEESDNSDDDTHGRVPFKYVLDNKKEGEGSAYSMIDGGSTAVRCTRRLAERRERNKIKVWFVLKTGLRQTTFRG